MTLRSGSFPGAATSCADVVRHVRGGAPRLGCRLRPPVSGCGCSCRAPEALVGVVAFDDWGGAGEGMRGVDAAAGSDFAGRAGHAVPLNDNAIERQVAVQSIEERK